MIEVSIENRRKSFIARASVLYSNKYKYTKFVYKNSYTKSTITCPIHGDFTQTATYHLHGGACPKCSKKQTEIAERISKVKTPMGRFVDKASNKFSNKYNYDNIVYDGYKKPIEIVCPVHGIISVKPTTHIRSYYGCPICGNSKKGGEGLGLNTEQAVSNFKVVHGDRYDYSKFIYVNSYTKGVIICKEHGEFEQNYTIHVRGSNCPICASKVHGANRTKTTEQFIIDARKVHGDEYDYSKTVYVTAHDKVIITCKIHGDFEQKPNSHISVHKNGCPKCYGRNNKYK